MLTSYHILSSCMITIANIPVMWRYVNVNSQRIAIDVNFILAYTGPHSVLCVQKYTISSCLA